MLFVAEPEEEGFGGENMARIAQHGGAFDFLAAEPDLYSDADIEAGHHNPDFGGHAPSRRYSSRGISVHRFVGNQDNTTVIVSWLALALSVRGQGLSF